MTTSSVQDILSRVEKPSRYLGTEINSVHKDPTTVKLNMALAFPDLYEIGMSHFGIQILYDILNKNQNIVAERVFAPALDMEAELRARKLPLGTLESGRALAEFDVVGFSLLYELNYTNVLNMLDLGGIPLRAEQRTASHPIVIAGGPCVANPEPMAPFFDAMLFGDGEDVVLQLAELWMQWKSSTPGDKTSLLKTWSQLEGVYIPQFYAAKYDRHGFQILQPGDLAANQVQRAIVRDLDKTVFPEKPIVPFGRPIHDRLRLEISRGCTRGCRFCQAGMIYRPVRERSGLNLLSIAGDSLVSTGYEDISLLSLSTGDYTCLSGLMENLMKRCEKEQVAVSLPSIRAGRLTPSLMAMIKKVRKTGFTIAPEAGSQRLRDVINKNITYDDVATTVRDAFSLGWHVIKLYFMIGLPTETDADLDAIVQMVKNLKTIKGPARRRGQINVSITTFIPKSHTPFQWVPQIDLESSYAKIERIRRNLKIPGVNVKWQDPAMSMLEGVMARGDRKLAEVIEHAWQKGALFDGWTDRFNDALWRQAFETCGVDLEFFTTRQRRIDEPLPWDHMQSGATATFLREQLEAAQNGSTHPDCRYGDCQQCGVCDFQHIQPRVFHECPIVETDVECNRNRPSSDEEGPFQKLVLVYQKLDQARFFGHLELANIIARAFRRARVDVQYSKGYHPMPRFSFGNPLPLGMESEGETVRVSVSSKVTCSDLLEKLNRHLPRGLAVTDCRPFSKMKSKAGKEDFTIDRYRVVLTSGILISNKSIETFQLVEQWPYMRRKGKGRVERIDLKEWIQTMRCDDHQRLYLELICRQGRTIRPADVLSGVFGLEDRTLQAILTRKLAPL